MDTVEEEEVVWTSQDGLKLSGRFFNRHLREAPLVVVLHGLTHNSAIYRAGLCRALSGGGGFRVVAVDVRGRGRSDRDVNIANYQLSVYARDVHDLMKHLQEKKAHFIGTSMGGLITATLSAINGDLIQSAVINDIGPKIELSGLQRIAGYAGVATDFKSFEDCVSYFRHIYGVTLPHFTRWSELTRALVTEDHRLNYDPNISKFRDDENLKKLPELFDRLKEGSRPVMVIRGALSDILSHETVVSYGVPYVEIPNVGHAPLLDEPEAIEAIVNFLNKAK